MEDKGVHTVDLHAGAGWKSILAFLPDAECASFLDRLSYQRITANTITSRTEFEKVLGEVRKRGYAIDNAEGREGLHCVAAPVFDRIGRPVVTLCISAPAEQLPETDFERRAQSVIAVAATVSAKLGWTKGRQKGMKPWQQKSA